MTNGILTLAYSQAGRTLYNIVNIRWIDSSVERMRPAIEKIAMIKLKII